MTAQEVRDLGYLAWRDPWAWMETMKGKRWEHLIESEKRHFHELSSQPRVEREARQMQQEIENAIQYVNMEGPTIGNGAIMISILKGRDMYWNWTGSKEKKRFADIDTQGNLVWYITDDDDHPNENILICEDLHGRILWKKKNVSDQVAVIDKLCYYIKVLNYFTSTELSCCDANSGNEEKLVYREKNEERYLNLYRAANRTLYLASVDPEQNQLFCISGKKAEPVFPHSTFQFPLGKNIDGNHCVLTKQRIQDPWTAHGIPIKDWILPSEQIQWVSLLSSLILTNKEGKQTIWFCAPHKRPRSIMSIPVGTMIPMVWPQWENSVLQSFLVKDPFEIPYLITVVDNQVRRHNNGIPIQHPVSFRPLEIHRFHARSKDGTMVPYVTIKERGCKPKGQFIYVYGSYGSTTPIDWPYQNWYPLLKRKWMIVFALVRGGGDVDDAWAEAARREHRHVSVDDFEAVIRASQKKHHLTPEKTVIYGRSAGGVPVGSIISRFPDGQLVGAAFTEVPYVDVLRTTSNPDLPLTKGEYKEFGNPKDHVLEFKELMSISPINTLPPDGAPGVFVMSHVGLLDRQVYAYESFKWIQKLRGRGSPSDPDLHPKGKYVAFERKEAHQYKPNNMPRFRAIDFSILDAWVEGELRFA